MEDFINDTTENNAKKAADSNRIYTPTEKQLAYADSIANYSKEPLTDVQRGNGHELSKWIDRNKISIPPTEKQLSFAESISEKTGVDLPQKTRNSKILLSEWIDKHK